ncbi:hypothetical protein PYCC9005_003558 [Savitreella phatthalungensis]
MAPRIAEVDEEKQSSSDGEGSASDNQSYVIDEILAHRGSGRHMELLIHWEGYDDEENTWEPVGQLRSTANEIVEEYLAKHAGAQKTAAHSTNRKRKRSPGVAGKATAHGGPAYSSRKAAAQFGSSVDRVVPLSPGRSRNQAASDVAQGDRASEAKNRGRNDTRQSDDAEGFPHSQQGFERDENWRAPFELKSWETEAEVINVEKDEDGSALWFVVAWRKDKKITTHEKDIVYDKLPRQCLAFYERNLVFKEL